MSAVGACILSAHPLGPGDRFLLYLPWGPDQYAPVVCTARASRVKLDGSFRVGVEFTEVNEATGKHDGPVVARLLGVALPAAVSGRRDRVPARPRQRAGATPRRSDRKPADGQALMYLYYEDGRQGPIEKVPARDVSEGGVCLLRPEPLEIGDRFVARVPVAGGKPVTRLCRVTNVSFADGRYRIGAEFIPYPDRATGLAGRVRNWLA